MAIAESNKNTLYGGCVCVCVYNTMHVAGRRLVHPVLVQGVLVTVTKAVPYYIVYWLVDICISSSVCLSLCLSV